MLKDSFAPRLQPLGELLPHRSTDASMDKRHQQDSNLYFQIERGRPELTRRTCHKACAGFAPTSPPRPEASILLLDEHRRGRRTGLAPNISGTMVADAGAAPATDSV